MMGRVIEKVILKWIHSFYPVNPVHPVYRNRSFIVLGDDVQTVVPEESGLTTDTVQHQFFVSVIKHF